MNVPFGHRNTEGERLAGRREPGGRATLTKRLAELQGGYIDVEGKYGRGSTFRCGCQGRFPIQLRKNPRRHVRACVTLRGGESVHGLASATI
ncbi:MAG: hypothetical protein JO015_00490 [Verrucomicrobia bacterium]|nr:hypothetical protein [Verrucomicrobiota bacterium]